MGVARIVSVLLVGWGLGWFVARSVAFYPIRNPLKRLHETMLQQAKERSGPVLREWGETGCFPPLIPVVRIAIPMLVSGFFAGVTHCAACSGFWIGCGLGAFAPILGTGLPGALATGAAVMGVNALLDAALLAAIAIDAGPAGRKDP